MATVIAKNCLDMRHAIKSWAKVLRSREDLDISRKDGYCLRTKFLDTETPVELGENEFMVCSATIPGAHTSSGRSEYRFALLQGGTPVKAISGEVIENQLAGLVRSGIITELDLTYARNNVFYGFGLWMWTNPLFAKESRTEVKIEPPKEEAKPIREDQSKEQRLKTLLNLREETIRTLSEIDQKICSGNY